MATRKAKRRILDFDPIEISGVDKAANEEKYIVFKRADENEQEIINGGDEVANKEQGFTEEGKKDMINKSKQEASSQVAQNPENAPPELEASIKNQEKEIFGKEVSGTEKVDNTEIQETVESESDTKYANLQSEVEKEKAYMKLLEEKAKLQADIAKLEARMPVRKTIEFPEDEVPDQAKDDIKKRLEESRNQEHKHDKEAILENAAIGIAGSLGRL